MRCQTAGALLATATATATASGVSECACECGLFLSTGDHILDQGTALLHSLTQSPTHVFYQSINQTLTHSRTHSRNSLTHSLTQITQSRTKSLTQSNNQFITHSLPYCFTRSLGRRNTAQRNNRNQWRSGKRYDA
jgi:hypothetical protein